MPSAILHLYHGGLIWLPGFDGHGCLDVSGKSRDDLKDNIPALYQAAQELKNTNYPVGAFNSNGIMKQFPRASVQAVSHMPSTIGTVDAIQVSCCLCWPAHVLCRSIFIDGLHCQVIHWDKVNLLALQGPEDLYYHVPFANNDQGLFLLDGE